MTIPYLIYYVLLIVVICVAIYVLKRLKYCSVSDNTKVQQGYQLLVKVLIFACYGLLAYTALSFLLVLISPIFDYLNAALDAAISRIFAFLDKLIPYAVLGGIGWAWWKSRHPKAPDTDKKPVVKDTDVAVELARQRGLELQKYMLAFLLRIIVATRNATNALPPDDAKGIAISSLDNQSFYMDGEVVIYQCEVQISGEITPEAEDAVRDELQAAVPKFITDFPMLIDQASVRAGYPAVEVLTVQKSGRRVTIDAVITSEQSIPIITARRQARVERKKRQERAGQADDPLFR